MIDPKYEYWATVLRWVDGDTVKLAADQGFCNTFTGTFRVLGLDTPERGQTNYEVATAFAEHLAPVGTTVAIRSHKADSFGRWLAEIQLSDGRMFSTFMIEAGLGAAYTK